MLTYFRYYAITSASALFRLDILKKKKKNTSYFIKNSETVT